MSILYPNGIDTFPNPASGTKRNASGFELSTVISNLGDAAQALEAEVGVQGSALAGLNPIINGGFDVWQDGATFTGIADATWGPDQWLYQKSGTMVHDLLRSTDVPTVAEAKARASYSLHLDVTTIDATLGAGDYCTILTRIEGHNWRRYDQQIWSLGFWVKTTQTGTHYVFARNAGADRSCAIAYTVSVADTWEYKTVTFPANPAAGTWDYLEGRGLEIGWTLAAGSTFTTTAGAWQTGSFIAGAGQVNEVASVNNNFKLAMVGRPTLGTVPARWQPEDLGVTQLRCYRYHYVYSAERIGTAATTQLLWTDNAQVLPVPMRATPTVASATFTASAGSAGTVSSSASGRRSLRFFNSAANWTVGALIELTASINARLP